MSDEETPAPPVEPTRFFVEALTSVRRDRPPGVAFEFVEAWVPAGAIDVDPGEYGATCYEGFKAWTNQEERPPGTYRVWRHQVYGMAGQTYEIVERVERDIRRVEGPLEAQLRDDLINAA